MLDPWMHSKNTEKIGEANYEKAGEGAEKAKPMVENEKQDPFSFRVLDSDVHDVLIFLTFY